jgi:hypothetical protein
MKPKFKRPTPKPFDPKDAAFIYTSMCCSNPAKKPALRSVANFISPNLGNVPETDDQTEGLGGWRCSACGKPCKVARTKNLERAPRGK